MAFGLVAFGTAFGEQVAVKDVVADYTEDIERVLGYGYDYVHRSELGLTDLAVAAGKKALAAAGVSPRQVDLLILAVTDIAEYLYWDAAAAVAYRLGLRRAEAVLIDQGCVGGVTCFDTLAGRFATHPMYQTALVIGANRTAEAYMNRFDTNSLLFSDGAAAAVASRDALSLTWRSSHAETEGAYADFFRMDVGGAAAPFDGPVPAVRDAWDIMSHFDYDMEQFSGFAAEINDRTARAVHRVCKQAGVSEDELGWLVLLNDNPRVLREQADLVGVPVERTNLQWATQHGHFGAADHLFVLAALRDEVRSGDLVALAANGRGMHWAATLLSA